MPTTTVTAVPGTQQVDFDREFAAPAELVHRAMTDPELIRAGSARGA